MLLQKKHTFLLAYFPALASGLLLTLSFPKTNLSYLAFFALIPWLVSIRSMTKKEAFYSGFTLGVFHFFTLIYWIIPTVHVYGGLHPILAVSTLALLCVYLALYPAVYAFLSKHTDPASFFAPLLAASLWTGLEYVRTYAFTGFSWGTLGYSQYSNLLLIQIADFSGVYGVSFCIFLVNCLLSVVWICVKERQHNRYVIPVVYTIILLSGVLVYGHHKIVEITSQIKTAKKTTITLVQGNIKQDLKWNDAFKTKTVEKYISLSDTAAKKSPDLVIWPETALPFYYGYDSLLSNKVDQCIRSSQTNFLIGSPAVTSEEKKIKFYNRAYMLNRFSIVTGTYDKTHLVPFGEYVPLGDYLMFLGKITAQAGNFSTGDKLFKPLAFNNHTLKVTHKTGVLICFEILFPSIASKFVKNGADILTTITNDAWFGNTSAAQQHFSIAVFRAVESRRAVARAANTGISGFIDPTGKILETTALFVDQTLTRKIPALNQISFYTRYGDIFAITSIVAICLAFVLKGVRKKV
ncbi:apolipoprotein N-acyltransferase [Desulfobacula toluolica]|uniref:Apolipoprotein N-acyltransferase n=1 Tax=Desulfobacula toluolica (strain DSM 7467 / Tol2) TaxID=651182 RepID=K0NNE2_DESTT|nr:apolipoprotein N-acyltransferase [Desulfobacula toluolica]CCK82160.1 Lnt: apolipoprotein N-acetyltransferase [Desulfobacula toluolica Tol2]